MHDIFQSSFAHDIFKQKYALTAEETWPELCKRVVDNVARPYLDSHTCNKIQMYMVSRKFIPAGRFLYSAGRPLHMCNNCFTFRAEDSREGWSKLLHNVSLSLLCGGGIGVDYSAIRENGALIKGNGSKCTGPLSLMSMINEIARGVMSGGQRRSACYASLNWNHKDVFDFINCKNHSPELKKLKEKDFNFPLPMELTNISVNFDANFKVAYESSDEHAKQVWNEVGKQAFQFAEPGWSFNIKDPLQSLRNACAEYCSSFSSDSCDLGTVFMSRCNSKEEFEDVCTVGAMFLVAGRKYTQVPYDEVREVFEEHPSIGLGIGGITEWLIMNRLPYKPSPLYASWLESYKNCAIKGATLGANQCGMKVPERTRAIAPNGTIGILAETSTGIEPIFAKAYKRRYFVDGSFKFQYVIDGAVRRLMDDYAIPEECIFDSYDLSFKDRVEFQAFTQQYVDMGISSTCNLPTWGSKENNESNIQEKLDILYANIDNLRGFTVYPDGCRGGQPLTRVSLSLAKSKEGNVYEDKIHECTNGICGI